MHENDSNPAEACPVCGYSYRCCDCHPDSIRAHDLNRQVADLRAQLEAVCKEGMRFSDEIKELRAALTEFVDAMSEEFGNPPWGEDPAGEADRIDHAWSAARKVLGHG